MEAEWYREQGHEVYWTTNPYEPYEVDRIINKPENLPFLSLPHPDRIFTNAKDKQYQRNGNFKYHPGTYIQSVSGCWWGKCSFCVENGQKYEVRSVEDVIQEIEEIKSQGYKEVFDDSATLPTGDWLDNYCSRISNSGIVYSANMRINSKVDYQKMKQAGFRMLLFGIESANQNTLDKINKGVKVEDIIPTIKKASEVGLEPHIAVMFGYPWESEKDAENTLKLVHYLLKKGYAKTAQASFYTSKDGAGNELQRTYCRKIYDVAYSPEFWFNRLKSIRNTDDIKYIWRGIKAAIYG